MTPGNTRLTYILGVLVCVQVFCAGFFLSDMIADYGEATSLADLRHIHVETLATLTLCLAIVIEVGMLRHLLRRKLHLERSVSIASAAVHEVIEAHFDAWGLTASEQDVATFLVKGMSIAEIATLRGNAEGTVKSHLNAIYRKSGTAGRGELLAVLLDSLMGQRERAAAPLVVPAELALPERP